MNGKHLLIVAFAAAFSGMNLVASEEVTIDTHTIIVRAKAYKAITDKVIRRHCRESNSDLCQELELLMATTDSIDLEKVDALISTIKEDMKSHSILKNILEDVKDVASDAKELIDAITEDSNKTE